MSSLLNVDRQHNTSWQLNVARDLSPYLDPLILDWLCRSPETLVRLTEMYGSPLNIVWPHTVAPNLQAMAAVTASFGVETRFYYGVKVNKSQALLRAAVLAGAGADVSSIQELRDALRAGCRGADLCATGPAKTRDFLQELILQDAQIVVDSPQELQEVIELARNWKRNSTRVRILLRLRPDASRSSRFGMPSDEIIKVLPAVASCKQVTLVGFHFHLNGYAPEPRVNAFFDTLPLFTYARSLGLAPNIIDIGGGLPVQYVESESYQRWFSSQSSNDYRTGLVPSSFYPYGGELNAARWLKQFLAGQDPQGKTVSSWLHSEGLTLCAEPGRSLVNQGAISIFRVCRVAPETDKYSVIFVEGSSFSACETWFNSEFLIDPLHLAPVNKGEQFASGKAWIAGHSCLDEDVITNRLVYFRRLPQPDDLLIFTNTAGYQMDLLENRFHRHPTPTRLTALLNTSHNLTFSIDK
ncbi:decarboxylase [Chania multitudinisentens RB-25]|uniref:Decarboxylase n=1 Tax=Chania multitudinisentens RB-25 TaxID=1441930 RepID=W0L821_9GAMM|nr:Y4yA family PLP-dependent enzyme [Chania multitudinisentens]AHG18397.1 decarboxylase [Chania multitudinisentens RB-25]